MGWLEVEAVEEEDIQQSKRRHGKSPRRWGKGREGGMGTREEAVILPQSLEGKRVPRDAETSVAITLRRKETS